MKDLPHARCTEDLCVMLRSSCRTIALAVSTTIFFYEVCLSFSPLCVTEEEPHTHEAWLAVAALHPRVCLSPCSQFSCSALSMHHNSCCPCSELKTHKYPAPIFAPQHWFYEQRRNDATRRKEKPKEDKQIHFSEVMKKRDSKLFLSSKMHHSFSTFFIYFFSAFLEEHSGPLI